MKIAAFHDATGYAPASEAWHAIDTDTYDADCDENGFFSTSPVGTGATAEAAIADLIEQMQAAEPDPREDDYVDPDILREDRDERRRMAAEDDDA